MARGLTREAVLDAALAIVDAQGLDALTARRLAKSLGVSAMAMYRHFADRDALVRALLDHVIDEPALLAGLTPRRSTRAALASVFRAIRDVFVAHPALAPLAGTPACLGPASLRVVETLLAFMRTRGVRDPVAVLQRAIAYTLGASLLVAATHRSDAIAVARQQLEGIEPAELPHVRAQAGDLLGMMSDRRFESGLRAVLGDV